MERNTFRTKSQIKRTCTTQGQSIEEKMRRLIANNEPIDATAPLIYTDKKDGVLPETDPRTDRFELALEATDKVTKTMRAKSMEKVEQPTETPEQ